MFCPLTHTVNILEMIKHFVVVVVFSDKVWQSNSLMSCLHSPDFNLSLACLLQSQCLSCLFKLSKNQAPVKTCPNTKHQARSGPKLNTCSYISYSLVIYLFILYKLTNSCTSGKVLHRRKWHCERITVQDVSCLVFVSLFQPSTESESEVCEMHSFLNAAIFFLAPGTN